MLAIALAATVHCVPRTDAEMAQVTARRLGWNEKTNVTDRDILDPYDYATDDLEGELVIVEAHGEYVEPHTVYLVGGQVADPASIKKL